MQTPPPLAAAICAQLARDGCAPRGLLEPTCGRGALLVAALERFGAIERALGVELLGRHARAARAAVRRAGAHGRATVRRGDAFDLDWSAQIERLPDPLLVLGNPPWVTSSALGALGSGNRPRRDNAAGLRGIDALTGRGGFDLSEWLLLRLLEALGPRDAVLAMLCKTSVARRVLAAAWRDGRAPARAALRRIDASGWFGASVEACLLVAWTGGPAARPAGARPPDARPPDARPPGANPPDARPPDRPADARPHRRPADARLPARPADARRECPVFDALDAPAPRRRLGFRDGLLLADVDAYERSRHLLGPERLRWRSGIKHDCARVMELRPADGGGESAGDDTGTDRPDGVRPAPPGTRAWINGLGERIALEDAVVFPLLKGSDVAAGRLPRRALLVPQRHLADDTTGLERRAPAAWAYLRAHAARLDARGSSVYRGRPPFAIFGVGPYAFAPWKVAVAGLDKRAAFRAVGPHGGRPIVLDDTVAFLACRTEREARLVAELLGSDPARAVIDAFVFRDAKRPLTIELLRRLDLLALARHLGRGDELEHHLAGAAPDGVT